MSRARDCSAVSGPTAPAPAAAPSRRDVNAISSRCMVVKAEYSPTVNAALLLRTRVVAAAFVLLAAGAAVQRVALGPSVEQGRVYTHYNNYVIFRDAFTHLRRGQDLYTLYPDEHWDLYKYSP